MADGKSNESKSNNIHALSQPDIKGWVAIRNDGAQTTASDETAEKLGKALLKLNTVTQKVATTFGLDKLEEIHIVCDEVTAVCMTGNQETIGVLFDKNTKPNEFLAKYKTSKS